MPVSDSVKQNFNKELKLLVKKLPKNYMANMKVDWKEDKPVLNGILSNAIRGDSKIKMEYNKLLKNTLDEIKKGNIDDEKS